LSIFLCFEETSDGRQLTAIHHLYRTSCSPEDIKPSFGCSSQAYDMVLNGTELGGGFDPYYSLQCKNVFENNLITAKKEQQGSWFSC